MNKNTEFAFPANRKRRKLLELGVAAGLLGSQVYRPFIANAASAGVLPLDTPGLDHLDIVVPDVEASAKFYMGLFNTTLHAQPYRGAFRYFVLLGELNEGREVGYMAIGASNGRGTYIGHFCTTVSNWRRDSDAIFEGIARESQQKGLGEFPGATGFGGIFNDPDGIEIQFLPSPDTLVTAAVPSDLAPHNAGPVTPLGLDYVALNVSNLDKALDFYRILYGEESSRSGQQAQYNFPQSDTRLILRESPYVYGNTPGIASFGIKTLAFPEQEIRTLLTSLGATVLPEGENETALRFTDLDGITVELNPI